jgi:hypothetical protein
MHWLGAVTCSHEAVGVVVVVVVAIVGAAVTASVVGGEDVVGASIEETVVVLAGEVDELDDVSEQAAARPSRARPIAAARLTWRLRHRAKTEPW